MTHTDKTENNIITKETLREQIRLYLQRHSLGETTNQTTLTIGEIASIINDCPCIDKDELSK